MADVLGITFPLFALIALGYGLVRFGVFSGEVLRALGRYVLNVAIPALIFSSVTRTPLSDLMVPAYVLTYAAAALVTGAAAWLWFRAAGAPAGRRGLAILGAAVPNSVFIGFPLLSLVLPDIAARAFAMNLVVENFLLIPLALLVAEAGRGGGGAPLRRIGATLLGLAKRPFVAGLIAGVAVQATGLPVPEPLSRTIDIVAASAAAVALIFIGGSLVGLDARGDAATAGVLVAAKLILMPAVAGAILVLLDRAGVTLPPDLAVALVIGAAVPTLSLFPVLAQDYGETRMASLTLLVSNVAAFGTINLLLWTLL